MCIYVQPERKREGKISPMPLTSPDTYQQSVLKRDQGMTICSIIPVLCISNPSVYNLNC